MAKRTATRRTERPARQGGSRGSTVAPERTQPRQQPDEERRPPFLKAADIGRGARLKPIPGTVRTLNGQFGQQLVVDVDLNGAIYSWGISVGKPNMRLFVEALVNGEKAIRVTTLISQSNRPYIAIVQNEQPISDDDDGVGRTRRGRAPAHVADDDAPF
jgi:hypothetical protein